MSLYRLVPHHRRGRCPACASYLPTTGEPRGMSLQVRSSRAVEGRPIREFAPTWCFTHLCKCGLTVAVQPGRDTFGYSVQCRLCRCFSANVNDSGWCFCCVLELVAGIHNAPALMDTLNESSAPIGPTRSDFLDSLLKGVILGVPGLVVPEPT